MRKRRFIRLALALTLALLTVASALPPALAAPDLDKKDCSITLDLKGMEGGTVALYKVAGVKQEDADYVYDVSKGDFADSDTAKRIPGISESELEKQNPTLSAILVKEADTKKLSPRKTASITGGKAVFKDLPVGLYLLNQTTASKDGKKLTPFLLSVPQRDPETGEEIYAVSAAPKSGITTPPPSVTPSHTPTPTHTPWPSYTPYYPTVTYTPGKSYVYLPQTGQLWWPVPVLAAFGVVLLIAGLLLRRSKED